MPIAGRTRWYASSLHGTTVLSPSLPPPIWMTTSTLSGSTPFANDGSNGEAAATCASARLAFPPRNATDSAEVTKVCLFIAKPSVQLVDGEVECQGQRAADLVLVVLGPERHRVLHRRTRRLRVQVRDEGRAHVGGDVVLHHAADDRLGDLRGIHPDAPHDVVGQHGGRRNRRHAVLARRGLRDEPVDEV